MTVATTFRMAAYGLCVVEDQVLLVQVVHRNGTTSWTLPGGGVEPLEDPFDTVVREVAEETGYSTPVEHLLGVDSRIIPANEARRGVAHQNIGVFYQVRIVDGALRRELNGDTIDPTWWRIAAVQRLSRSSLIDVGLRMWHERPVTGHVDPVPVRGLIQH